MSFNSIKAKINKFFPILILLLLNVNIVWATFIFLLFIKKYCKKNKNEKNQIASIKLIITFKWLLSYSEKIWQKICWDQFIWNGRMDQGDICLFEQYNYWWVGTNHMLHSALWVCVPRNRRKKKKSLALDHTKLVCPLSTLLCRPSAKKITMLSSSWDIWALPPFKAIKIASKIHFRKVR